MQSQTDNSDLLVVSGADILSLIANKERQIIDCVRSAYMIHGRSDSSLPRSSFLTFPGNPKNRIISLPAYVGKPIDSAGVKWISSFPDNIDRGIDRASAVLVLNSMLTGRPKAILEGSIISAKRTAASAALAAGILRAEKSKVAGFIGCGVINLEILHYLRYTCPDVETYLLYDIDRGRARLFQSRCKEMYKQAVVVVAPNINTILKEATLISFATTATTPHVKSLESCATETVILHVSLRDISAKSVLCSDNVVDDLDHVCRAQTSIHLAEQEAGNRSFVRCSLADILNGNAAPRPENQNVSIFNPFGLGILDVALGELVLSLSIAQGKGQLIPHFFPNSWDRTFLPAAVSQMSEEQSE